MGLTFTVREGHEFADVSRALRKAPQQIRRDATNGVKSAGTDVVRELRREALKMPVTGYSLTGVGHDGEPVKPFRAKLRGGRIRHRIAANTRFVVRLLRMPTVEFSIATERLGTARKVPGRFDSGKIFWHPLPRTRSRWARIKGRPFFRVHVLRRLPYVQGEVDRELNHTRRLLDRR